MVEIRREDGKPYPATSIRSILAGLYRYCRECVPTGVVCPNFMNRRDPCFRDLTGALQVKFRELREDGIGAIVKHAPVVLPEEEEKFWDTKVFGVDSPVALQRAVFFYVGKVCCLRGGEEQRNLKPSQFVRNASPHSYTYVENGSKNYSGVDPTGGNKCVPIYACPENQLRCLVYLLDLYFSKFPQKGFDMDVFYLRPKKSAPESLLWYDCVPIGKHKLNTFMQAMCADAGVEKKTNHSLRATGATALFNAGVAEKMIRDVTGHRSNAIQLYERPTEEQKKQVSKIMMNSGSKPSIPESASLGKENYFQGTPASREWRPYSTESIFGSVFSGLNNCNVTLTPQNFTVNLYQAPPEPVENLLDGIELKDLYD